MIFLNFHKAAHPIKTNKQRNISKAPLDHPIANIIPAACKSQRGPVCETHPHYLYMFFLKNEVLRLRIIECMLTKRICCFSQLQFQFHKQLNHTLKILNMQNAGRCRVQNSSVICGEGCNAFCKFRNTSALVMKSFFA